MAYNSTITYAGQSLNLINIDQQHIQAPFIQKMGKTLSITSVPTETMAWRLVLRCRLLGSQTDMFTSRQSIQDAEDDKIEHALADGVHDGNYVCEGISWGDNAEDAATFTNMPFVRK